MPSDSGAYEASRFWSPPRKSRVRLSCEKLDMFRMWVERHRISITDQDPYQKAKERTSYLFLASR